MNLIVQQPSRTLSNSRPFSNVPITRNARHLLHYQKRHTTTIEDQKLKWQTVVSSESSVVPAQVLFGLQIKDENAFSNQSIKKQKYGENLQAEINEMIQQKDRGSQTISMPSTKGHSSQVQSLAQINNKRMIQKFKRTLDSSQKRRFASSTFFTQEKTRETNGEPTYRISNRIETQSLARKCTQRDFQQKNQDGQLEKSLKQILNFENQSFKVLKNAHKDINMNYDMFVTNNQCALPEHPDLQKCMIFVKEAIGKLFEERKWDVNKIDMDTQFSEASFVFRQVLKAFDSELFVLDKSISEQFKVLFCLLWTFLTTSLDETLFKQANQIRELNQKMEFLIEERVVTMRTQFKSEVFRLNEKNRIKMEEIERHKTQIEELHLESYELKTKLQEESEKILSFKDPDGCVAFRQILQQFEKDLSYLSKEKEKQYKSMRQSLRLLEEIDLENSNTIQESQQKQAESIENRIQLLKTQQIQLQMELEKLNEKCKIVQPNLMFVRKLKPPKQHQTVNEVQQTVVIQDSRDFDKTFEELLAMNAQYTKDQIQAMRNAVYNEAYQHIKMEIEQEMKIQFKEFLKQKFRRDKLQESEREIHALFSEFFQLSDDQKQSLENVSVSNEKKKHGSPSKSKRAVRKQKRRKQKESNDYDEESDEAYYSYYSESEEEDQQEQSKFVTKSSQKRKTLTKSVINEEESEDQKLDDSELSVNFLGKEEGKKQKVTAEQIEQRTQIKQINEYIQDLQKKSDSQSDSKESIQSRRKNRLQQNSILKSVQNVLSKKKYRLTLTKEHFIVMKPRQVYDVLLNMIQEKVYHDMDMNKMLVEQRVPQTFANFLHDHMIMKYGFFNIALKHLFQLVNALKLMTSDQPFGYKLAQLCSLAVPDLRFDEINIIMRSFMFFKVVQEQWIKRVKEKFNYLEITDDNEWNMITGGECSIFELMFELKKAMSDDIESQFRVISGLKPDFFSQKVENFNTQRETQLEFGILKITQRLARSGKDIKKVFQMWDLDQSGFLDPNEIVDGFTRELNVFLSQEEKHLLVNYLDKDGNGLIDINEFVEKINYKDYQKRSHKFLISAQNFVERMLCEWYTLKGKENQRLYDKIIAFDENGDNLFQFSEFQNLMKMLEPKITTQFTLQLFKQTLAKNMDCKLDYLTLEVLINLIQEYQIGGYGKLIFQNYLEQKRNIIRPLKHHK